MVRNEIRRTGVGISNAHGSAQAGGKFKIKSMQEVKTLWYLYQIVTQKMLEIRFVTALLSI